MALAAALVDKARIHRKTQRLDPTTQQPVKVAGGKIYDDVIGEWFRAFYNPGANMEARDTGTVRREQPATLLVGKRDLTGQPVDLQNSDRVEIDSKRHGQLTLEITGIEVVASKYARLGQLATLREVTR